MVEQITLLFAGFLLTTIAGGLLGALIQHRSWRYRWHTENAEKNISTSRELFQEISRLMDRRLYRLDQFYLWSKRNSAPELKSSLENYRSVVVDRPRAVRCETNYPAVQNGGALYGSR
jgi:hypothetical protein